MFSIDPLDHCWAAEDGRVFSSAAQALIPVGGQEFRDWAGRDRANGRAAVPSIWPRDEAGLQSDAALQAVLSGSAPGVFVSLAEYAKDRRWRAENGGMTVASLFVATDDVSKIKIAGAARMAERDPAFTTLWAGKTPVDAAAAIAIQDALTKHVNDTFLALGRALDGIAAGTLTTRAEIDALFA